MSEREGLYCSICGVDIYLPDYTGVQPINWEPRLWLRNAVALEGPEGLGEPVEPSGSHPEELLTWHAATGDQEYSSGAGMLKLLPSGESVYPHTVRGNMDSPLFKSGYLYLGFHSACEFMARQFIQRSPGSKLKSFCDIWITLNARYSNGPGRCSFWDYESPAPRKTERGTYVWDSRAAHYLPRGRMSWRGDWWERDPIHIPNLTSRLLESLTLRHVAYGTQNSQFQDMVGSLPRELVDEILGRILYGSMEPRSTDLLPQRFWKQILVQIPFLWDIDVEQVQQFPDPPADREQEWDWELLVRSLMARPRRDRKIECENLECTRPSFRVWDYGEFGLDLPPGLTNRRRIWQFLEDMDPKELDVLENEDFIVFDSDLDEFIALTVKDGVNVEDPYGNIDLDWGESTPWEYTTSEW